MHIFIRISIDDQMIKNQIDIRVQASGGYYLNFMMIKANDMKAKTQLLLVYFWI